MCILREAMILKRLALAWRGPGADFSLFRDCEELRRRLLQLCTGEKTALFVVEIRSTAVMLCWFIHFSDVCRRFHGSCGVSGIVDYCTVVLPSALPCPAPPHRAIRYGCQVGFRSWEEVGVPGKGVGGFAKRSIHVFVK